MAKIIVVDDEKEIRQLINRCLPDHQVFLAGGGDEAIKIAREEKADLVILDIGMPGKNGLETCRDLRLDPDLKDIPILMLTGHGKMEMVEESFRALANDYMQKPFMPKILAARVNALLKK